MNILLLGSPGCGKGTQSQYLSKKYGVCHISTGDMLREISKGDSQEAESVRQTMERGELVSDDYVIQLVKERLRKLESKDSLLLDGFPRTLYQVKSLKELGIKINHVIELRVPDEVIINRVGGRRVHPESGRTYHIVHNPPLVPGKDDLTGQPLILRDDDTEVTVKKRLSQYHDQTAPIAKYYKEEASLGLVNYISIDGTITVQEVSEEISAKI